MRPVLALSVVLALAACSRPGERSAPSSEAVAVDLAAPSAPAAKASARAAVSPVQAATAQTLPQLAYVYQTWIEAPAAAVPGLLARHETACRSAGAAVCQIISAQGSSRSGDASDAQLTLRAEPGWLQRFRGGLAGDAQSVKGKVTGSVTKSEDLTRSIVDTEAALRAKTVLAGRLEQLLATRQGKLSELLELERALAQVQGEIDAARSELAVMRTRVATSELTLSYNSRPLASGDGAWRPLSEAVRGSVKVFATVLAVLVTLAAAALPIAALAGLGWLVWRRTRRPRAKAPSGG